MLKKVQLKQKSMREYIICKKFKGEGENIVRFKSISRELSAEWGIKVVSEKIIQKTKNNAEITLET